MTLHGIVNRGGNDDRIVRHDIIVIGGVCDRCAYDISARHCFGRRYRLMARSGFAPMVQEVVARCPCWCSPPDRVQHACADCEPPLEASGHIQRTPGLARGIRILNRYEG